MIRLSVAEIFGKGMVLQRNKPISVFGCGEKGDKINVSIFNPHGKLVDEIFTVIKPDGSWLATLSAMTESVGNKIVVEDSTSQETIVIEKVSVGEVWLAGGQSNMEFFNKYDKDWQQTKELPFNENVHFYNVPQRAFEGHEAHNGPGRDGYGKWLNDKDKGYENFSAIGYIFARKIQEKLKVPVGIIGCNWGGTTASAWVPLEVLKEAPLDNYIKEYEAACKCMDEETMRKASLKAWEVQDDPDGYRVFEQFLYGKDRKTQLDFLINQGDEQAMIPLGPYSENRPAGLYETMLKKVIPYGMQGVLWYQGESDSGERAFYYDKLMKGLIESWRKDWNDDLTFIITQLAPFKEWLACTNDNYMDVRRMQQLVADTEEKVYMTSIMDIGNYYDIHPKEKVEIGRRMSLLALAHVYDKLSVDKAENPRFDCAKREGGKISLAFKYAENLSEAGETTIKITSEDKILEPKKVSLEDAQVIVELPDEISENKDIKVSMGWDDYAIINIKNEQGLPIAPFEVAI